MEIKDHKLIIETWIKHHKSSPTNTEINEETFWAYDKLNSLCSNSPELAFEIILDILKSDSSDSIIANLAAGPLEDLLVRNGDKIIDKIEFEAKKNKVFQNLLGGVWKNAINENVWNRLQIIISEKW